jgi:small subunit ribosomal protein S6
MREYEMVYILQPQMTEAQINQLNAKLKSLIEKNDGRLFYAKSLGKKNLAYAIKKQTKGIYYDLDYAANGGCVAEIERSLMLDENCLRFLTVVKADKVDIEARAAEIEAKGEGLPVTEEKEGAVKVLETKDFSYDERESKEE